MLSCVKIKVFFKTRLFNRRYLKTSLAVLFGMIVGVWLTYGWLRFDLNLPKENLVLNLPSIETELSLPSSLPTKLAIPSLKLSTDFETPLGVQTDKSIMIPKSYDQVGWYKYGVTPGEKGTAVILGHVDSVKGPAVFFSLGQLKVGDEIKITRADNKVAVFAVTELKRYEQDDFPTTLVYGQTPNSTLRLVTCSGIFNHGSQRYSHNLVVYANLVRVE